MTAKMFIVVFFLLLLAAILEGRNSDELEYPTENYDGSLTKEELEDIVAEFMKKKNHEHKRRHSPRHKGACGAKAVRKIGSMCPKYCSVEDESLLFDLCTTQMEDDEIVKRCCP
ncbi:CRE-INS-20 protein [Caenorhabditis remanei]|uniref:CRE-INS-20 protein n=1 Tax=Caenorhabditis remanei TaxID=31234 RepID=E3LRD7_CAERE|nr:CRE-INS-20 protein [Caenorhabditis remanei]